MLTWNCFVKWLEPTIVLILYYPLSNLVHTISDRKGTHMNCLGVIQRCIKTHLYPVAFIGMCNFFHCIWVFIFYFISIVYYVISQLSACTCTSDTCILKDQSNQSNIANDDITFAARRQNVTVLRNIIFCDICWFCESAEFESLTLICLFTIQLS